MPRNNLVVVLATLILASFALQSTLASVLCQCTSEAMTSRCIGETFIDDCSACSASKCQQMKCTTGPNFGGASSSSRCKSDAVYDLSEPMTYEIVGTLCDVTQCCCPQQTLTIQRELNGTYITLNMTLSGQKCGDLKQINERLPIVAGGDSFVILNDFALNGHTIVQLMAQQVYFDTVFNTKCAVWARGTGKSGLSPGAIAGIVIAALAIVAIAVFAFWFYRRTRANEYAHI